VEGFLDAIPGCLRSNNSGFSIADIGELLSWEDEDEQMSQRIVQLFASCVDADRMGMTARRQHAIWEILNALMFKRVKADLPEPASKILRQLAQDHDAADGGDGIHYERLDLTGPSREDLDVAKRTLGELCRCLDSKKFSDSAQ